MNQFAPFPDTKYSLKKLKGHPGIMVMQGQRVVQVIHPVFSISTKTAMRFKLERIGNFRREELDIELTLLKDYFVNRYINYPLEMWKRLEFQILEPSDEVFLRIKTLIKV